MAEEFAELERLYGGTCLHSMLEGGQIIGFDWRYLYVNDAACRQSRRTKEEFLGRTVTEVYPGIENTAMFAHLRRCLESRLPHSFEDELTFPDGTRGWFEFSIEAVPEGVFIFSRDITERKKAEERIVTLNSVLRAVRGVNQLIIHERDRERLIQRSCELMVGSRSYARAWILLVDKDKNVVSVAAAGVEERLSALTEELRQNKYIPCIDQILTQEPSFAIYDDVSTLCTDCNLAYSQRHRSRLYGEIRA